MIENSPFNASQLLDALAGGLGGFVKGISLSLPFKEMSIATIVGAICAIYLAPIGDAVLDPVLGKFLATEKQVNHLGGFVVGVVGIGLVGFIMGVFKRYQTERTGR